MVSASYAISENGLLHHADIEYDDGWRSFQIGPETHQVNTSAGMWAPGLPVEIHCHGIGSVDFSDFSVLDLDMLEQEAAKEGVVCVPTLYLPYSRFASFLRFMRRFRDAQDEGRLPHLAGVALEGPLLASFGGTPEQGVWSPTRQEWTALAACGRLGLRYVVLSPDADAPSSHLSASKPDLDWIVTCLVSAGVRPAFGHFVKAHPRRSAAAVERLLDVAEAAGARRGAGDVITDHLFNDMPLRFKHAFRTEEERRGRPESLRRARIEEWSWQTLEELAGPVPAVIMRNAAAGRLKACLNFDGEHVDPVVVARALDLAGTENVMLMTDRSDVARLGGQALHHRPQSGLWYQAKGVVAAGSQPIDRQMQNALSIGLDHAQMWRVASLNAWHVLYGRPPTTDRGCFMIDERRFVVESPSSQSAG